MREGGTREGEPAEEGKGRKGWRERGREGGREGGEDKERELTLLRERQVERDKVLVVTDDPQELQFQVRQLLHMREQTVTAQIDITGQLIPRPTPSHSAALAQGED